MFANINRDILILKPKQALFHWVQSVFEDQLIKEGFLWNMTKAL